MLYAAPRRWPKRLTDLFVQLGPDAGAAEFVRTAPRASVARTVLHHSLCMLPLDDFDVNAWLGIYPLHLLTRSQIERMFAAAGVPTPVGRALDVGAGDGLVTKELARLCDSVTAAETSRGMARHLSRQGFSVWTEDVAETASDRKKAGDGGFDLAALLNVLDRCAKPRAMLESAHTLLAPPCSSWLLLSTPLPFRGAYFGWRTYWTGRPVEPLVLKARADAAEDEAGDDDGEAADELWGEQAREVLEELLPDAGFEPVAVSRVPYLCGGDAFAPLSVLDDLVVLARKI